VSPDILLCPGAYYFALSVDNTTATFVRMPPGKANARKMGHLRESSFPLPSSMTPVAIAETGYLPVIGLTSTDSGF
jgi:hypothetical protein